MELGDLGLVLVDQRLRPLPSNRRCLVCGRWSLDIVLLQLLHQSIVLDDKGITLSRQLVVLMVPVLLTQLQFGEGFVHFSEFVLFLRES